MQETGRLIVHPWNKVELERANVLMGIYRNTPMDFADASLVAAAETLNKTQVFTLDGHFYAYRINDHRSFEIIPG